jgi:putative transposase
MPRQPRLEVVNGLYHITNRGLERRNIVHDERDRRTWLRLLDRIARRCQWRVFAYTLLDNHFHLYLRLRARNLSLGMHDLESGYATLFNKNHERSGPLFQSRFHAVLVENDSHSLELTRYIHLNAVRASIVQNPISYSWSSYRYYLDPRHAPDWLDWGAVLAGLSQRESMARIAYKRFVEAGLRVTPANPLARAVDGWILGSDSFVARCRDAVLRRVSLPKPRLSLDQIINVTAERFGVSADEARQRGRHGNRARDVAVLLAREMLTDSLESLADQFGVVSRSAITETARRARQRLETDDAFRQAVDEIRTRLGM